MRPAVDANMGMSPRFDLRLSHLFSLSGCIERSTRQACVRSDTADRTNEIRVWREGCLT